MLGWINDCVEKLVLNKFGVDAWHIIKQKANCDVEDGGFLKLDHYSDKSTIDLCVAASEVSGLTFAQVLEAFGEFFVHYIRDEGYDNLLCCQGSTLKDWMSNINAIHQHLQTTFPKKMIMPQFWCQESDAEDGSLVLHYHSRRGNHLAPLAKGLVSEIARFQFQVEIEMAKTQTQDVDGAKFTSWRITTKDPADMWKLSQKMGERDGVKNAPTSFKCPFTGMTARIPSKGSIASMVSGASDDQEQEPMPEIFAAAKGTSAGSDGNLGYCLSDSETSRCSNRWEDEDDSTVGGGDDDMDLSYRCPHATFAATAKATAQAQAQAQVQVPARERETPSASDLGYNITKPIEPSSAHRTAAAPAPAAAGCPMHSAHSNANASNANANSSSSAGSSRRRNRRSKSNKDINRTTDSMNGSIKKRLSIANLAKRLSIATSTTSSTLEGDFTSVVNGNEVGLSPATIKTIQPYHVVIDHEFTVVQVGNSLPNVLHMDELDIVGQPVTDVLEITKPMGMVFDWKWLSLIEDQVFTVEPVNLGSSSMLNFQVTVVHVSHFPPMAMLMMTPQANNLGDLRDMNLTLSDLPVHGAHRDAIFLREHLSTQMNNALKMEKLSRSLEREKTLLESLLPTHAAEGLRKGRSVEPRIHNKVTMFFSDIVGFTSICDQIYPWEVIAMLNRLYCVMDYLAKKFNLYKVETIGDAYVCAAGLPEADPDHAMNVANFALAVQHCCKLVLSPVDKSTPIQLRIGVHTGPCASGVVGMTNPRYCVFGDTVNTTARHESTGKPGMIHVSSQTEKALMHNHPGMFRLAERGMVLMKGKGELRTFFLHESQVVHSEGFLDELEVEIKDLLQKYDFDATPDKYRGGNGGASTDGLSVYSGNNSGVIRRSSSLLSHQVDKVALQEAMKDIIEEAQADMDDRSRNSSGNLSSGNNSCTISRNSSFTRSGSPRRGLDPLGRRGRKPNSSRNLMKHDQELDMISVYEESVCESRAGATEPVLSDSSSNCSVGTADLARASMAERARIMDMLTADIQAPVPDLFPMTSSSLSSSSSSSSAALLDNTNAKKAAMSTKSFIKVGGAVSTTTTLATAATAGMKKRLEMKESNKKTKLSKTSKLLNACKDEKLIELPVSHDLVRLLHPSNTTAEESDYFYFM